MRKLSSGVSLAVCLSWPGIARADEPEAPPVPEPVPIEEPVVLPPPPVVIPEAPTMMVAPQPISAPVGHAGARQRAVGFTLVGLGTLTTAVGAIFIFSGKSTYDDAKATVGCTDAGCPFDAADRANAARTQVDAGGIVLLAGLGAVAAGIIVWVTAPSLGGASAPSVGFAPAPGGLSAVGRF